MFVGGPDKKIKGFQLTEAQHYIPTWRSRGTIPPSWRRRAMLGSSLLHPTPVPSLETMGAYSVSACIGICCVGLLKQLSCFILNSFTSFPHTTTGGWVSSLTCSELQQTHNSQVRSPAVLTGGFASHPGACGCSALLYNFSDFLYPNQVKHETLLPDSEFTGFVIKK